MIFGAASAIATETARYFAAAGADLFLADINEGRLEAVRDDLKARYGKEAKIAVANALDFDKHEELFNAAVSALGGLDSILIAHGTLPNQLETQKSVEKTIREFSINCLGVISLATVAANYFEERGKGMIAVISSVAGDRGRKSNYIYGAAKGGVSKFLQGLRGRLDAAGVKVLDIKPGMVDTPMTAHMKKGPLFSNAKEVAKSIYNAMLSGKDVVYVPAYWSLIMHIIKHIPESVFKKLNL